MSFAAQGRAAAGAAIAPSRSGSKISTGQKFWRNIYALWNRLAVGSSRFGLGDLVVSEPYPLGGNRGEICEKEDINVGDNLLRNPGSVHQRMEPEHAHRAR